MSVIEHYIEEETENEDYDDAIAIEEDCASVTVEELLITCVQVRTPIWDSRLPLKDRTKAIRDELWLQIYKEFGEQPQFRIEFLMKRWRNLRDSYVRLKGEYEAYTPSGSGAQEKKKRWEFFDMMVFLNETLTYRATSSHLKPNPTPRAGSLAPSPSPSPTTTGETPKK